MKLQQQSLFGFGDETAAVEAIAVEAESARGRDDRVTGEPVILGPAVPEPDERSILRAHVKALAEREGVRHAQVTGQGGGSAGKNPGLPRPTWREVPQAIFNSWDAATRARYCAARDLDSAKNGDEPWMREFFEGRAKLYEEMARAAG